MYIVDANNLAGQLGWLEKKDFDKQLIGILVAYFSQKNKKAKIVFDGNDFLAGQKNYGQIEIVYANSISSADDKIVNLVHQAIRGQAFVLVTNDRELQKRVQQAGLESKATIKFVKASDFVKKLEKENTGEAVSDFKPNLSHKEIEEINKELLKLWT